jgi:hypothetical protein
MKHLVLTIHSGWVAYTMGESSGSHPIGDDLPAQTVNYLLAIIKPDSYEIINHN